MLYVRKGKLQSIFSPWTQILNVKILNKILANEKENTPRQELFIPKMWELFHVFKEMITWSEYFIWCKTSESPLDLFFDLFRSVLFLNITRFSSYLSVIHFYFDSLVNRESLPHLHLLKFIRTCLLAQNMAFLSKRFACGLLKRDMCCDVRQSAPWMSLGYVCWQWDSCFLTILLLSYL